MERTEQSQLEKLNLQAAHKLDPTLFPKLSHLEDSDYLRNFGIFIPGKEELPQGFLRLYASDFIVEEIDSTGQVLTIERPTELTSPPSRDPSNESHRALFATLVKCNISTHEVVREMAAKLDCPVENIRYAGLKDKHAITAQTISFHNISTEKIASLPPSAHYFLKDWRWDKGSMDRGGLKGNRFTLFIRTPQPVQSQNFLDLEKQLSKQGFYNFYYLQRFGVPRLINFQWGFEILRGHYQECVTSFLTESNERELPFFSQLREKIRGLIPDWSAIRKLLEPYPLIMHNEIRLIEALQANNGDYLKALVAMPDQTMLWVYAFASLLFNEQLTRLIQTNKQIPEFLPLLLSPDPQDLASYRELLSVVGGWPLDFKNLRPFKHIYIQKRKIQTKEKISIEQSSFSPEGVCLRFSLNKGEYATTFLAHLFNIISGAPPAELSSATEIDTAALMGNNSNHGTLDYFRPVNLDKNSSFLDDNSNT